MLTSGAGSVDGAGQVLFEGKAKSDPGRSRHSFASELHTPSALVD